MKKILTLTALGTILMASEAMAAGFHLREQSAAAQGNAFAGATAGAENNSYAYFNVAGLTRHKGNQVNAGVTYIAPRAKASNIQGAAGSEDIDIDNIVHAAWAPNGTFSHQVDDKTTVGVSLNVPFGMITKYDSRWVGSDHGNTSKVVSTTITPMAAYKVNDHLSIGAGLPIQYVKAKLSNSAANRDISDVSLQGDTVDVGYQLGAMYEFNEDARIGVGYRSEINHKLKGDIESNEANSFRGGAMAGMLNQDISAKLDTPAMLSVGGFYQLNEKWALMAEYQRVFWSSFKSLDIVGDSVNSPATGMISSTKENWRDTDFYAVGASYQIDHQWKGRFGGAFDQAAVTISDRTPRIPDSDRIWFSAGLNYQYSENLSFDMAYTYIKAKKATVDMSLTENAASGSPVSARYSNSVKLFGLSLNYKF